MSKQTIRQFFNQFPDDDTCLQHLFNVRYGKSHALSAIKRATGPV